ncbi:MAG: hypothetical protein V1845_03900 [bacterium]
MKTYKKIVIFSFLVSCFLFFFLPLLAQGRIVPECIGTDGKAGPCELCDFFKLLKNIFNFIAFNLAPPLAGFLFLLAGFFFLTSGGSEDQAKRAKKIFTDTVIGLVIIFTSWLIVNSIIQIIGKNVDGFQKETWYDFKCTNN